jgi:SAM-dependent methyltransferase
MLSYDAIAGFYDWDMGRNNPGHDVGFYVQEAAAGGGPVLELGCGTGRITLPLVQAGLSVTGVDSSLPMLCQLQEKAGHSLSRQVTRRLQITAMDMRHLGLSKGFARILCPFSLLTYVVDSGECQLFLRQVQRLLLPGGQFLLDVFVPDEALVRQPEDRWILDYRREIPGGRILERQKQVRKKSRLRQIHTITRIYRFYSPQGTLLKEVITEEDIHYFHPQELRTFLKSHGFRIVAEYGDFRYGRLRADSKEIVLVCAIPD